MKTRKSKKGVSVIVGYVLLITFSVFLGAIVYKFLVTLPPREGLNCPDTTSLLIESYNYDCDSKILTLNIVNNGKFNVGGYFIYGADSPNLTVGNTELSQLNMADDSKLTPLGVKFGSFTAKNSLKPNDEETDYYNLTSINRQIFLVQIVPIRWQTQNRKMNLVSCQDAIVRKGVECD
ncbi:MAG: hypothetical protein NTZ83_05200 [Candidatus Pacearchaeota archaeon]|nr:hypothetical protein [Candidatus Pacearchaeota archaeon]